MVRVRHAVARGWEWIPPGGQTRVAGHDIPGGMVYVGRHVDAAAGETEPALINPDLPISGSAQPLSGRAATLALAPLTDHAPAPAYHLISPATRTVYLDWLAGGRRGDVPAGLVLLFCYGLERRVLLDAGTDPAARRELPAITAEVRRLRARYGAAGPPLRDTIDRLLDLVELLGASRGAPDAGDVATPPAPGSARAPVPMALRVALARFAATATPVPAAWARAWTRYHPSLSPRAAEVRCPEEFDRLFALRYLDRFGAGLVPPDDVPGIRLRYRPANPGLTITLVCREDLPDVLAEPRSTRALGGLVDAVAVALGPYSRWLAKFPEGRGSLAGATLLPGELVDTDRGRLGALRGWAEAHLDGRPRAVVDGAEFAAFWSTAEPHRMARDEAAALAAVLALVGVGVEPDARFGTPPLADGPAVLFRLDPAAADRPDARVGTAAAIARCAAAVASAAGPVDPQGPVGARVLGTVPDLAMPLRLPPSERPRLAARLAWLLTTAVNIDRLARQTAALGPAEREIAGRYLVSVAAAADPAIGPATVAALMRTYQVLGLDRDLLFRRVHGHNVGSPSDDRSHGVDEPVVIRPADPVTGGYALPWSATLRLDEAVITRKLTESAEVASLLADVFADEEAVADAARPVAGAGGLAGLDRAHSLLLRVLAARREWSREEFAVLAGAHGILPDGAIDLLNEAAIETAGAPVIEGDATLAVNDDVLEELLG